MTGALEVTERVKKEGIGAARPLAQASSVDGGREDDKVRERLERSGCVGGELERWTER